MRKRIYIGNILSSLPAALVVPLAPFVFILINSEGRIPGYFHEYIVRSLMIIYPITLIICLIVSIKLMRQDRLRPAFYVSVIPLLLFLILAAVFYFGGVVMR